MLPIIAELAATRVATGAEVSITIFLFVIRLPIKFGTGNVKIALLPSESLMVALLRAREVVLT